MDQNFDLSAVNPCAYTEAEGARLTYRGRATVTVTLRAAELVSPPGEDDPCAGLATQTGTRGGSGPG
jgi:hypothetical protein